VPASVVPVSAHYVALGHLHRRQALPAPDPVHYSGAPLAVDFGEQDNTSVVCLVEATPGTPARITDIPVTSGRRLRTVYGTLAELEARAGDFGDDYLRVYLREPTRAGLRDDTLEILPNALRCASTRSSRPRYTPRPDPPIPARRGHQDSVRPTTVPRGTSATRGSRPCSGELHDECHHQPTVLTAASGPNCPRLTREGQRCARSCSTCKASRRFRDEALG